MNINEAKEQVKATVTAYLSTDDNGMLRIPLAKQRPLFLIGAPGIGKTAIMSQVSREMGIGLVSYSMTHHTRQSALGLPRIVHHTFQDMEYEASEYTMSEIVAAIYEYIDRTGLDKGILFLDEINCVSETLYPSMLQFLQFKTFGQHRIPEGWVVVCAGNPPEYNRSVHEFDIVTLDRLRKITIDPDLNAWRMYAVDNGIHPAVLSFLDIKKDSFYSVESTPEGKVFVTARGWEDLSETMKTFDELGLSIDQALVQQFIQKDDIAEDFAFYYELFKKYREDYRVEDILAGHPSLEINQRAQAAAFDERLALLGLIVDRLTFDCEDTLEKETIVASVRDLLKHIKEPLLQGGSLDETLHPVIEDYEAELKAAVSDERLSASEERIRRRTLAFLKEMGQMCVVKNTMSGSEAFDVLHYMYRGLVGELEQAVKAVQAKLDASFAFIDDVFENEREGLVFITEIIARKAITQFISKFGSQSYYSHSDSLMVEGHRDVLFTRIDELLEDVTKKSDASHTAENLNEYYANGQLEYGFASLCKMTLPENLDGKNILDIGCRRGKGVFKLSSRVGNSGFVVGMDWVPEYITEARARMERAWQDSGLSANNMAFELGYPEELATMGFKDSSFDMIFINSVINLVCDQNQVLRECYRVLKPGGTLILESTFANGERMQEVQEKARHIGNSIQASPSREQLVDLISSVGFREVVYQNEHSVQPADGALPDRPVPVVDTDEDIEFTACVMHVMK